MSVARIYRMIAAPEKGDDLARALVALVPVVSVLPGCSGAEVLRDTADPLRFLFIEKWDSIDAHKAGASALPKGSLDGVMAALASPPEGSYEEYL
jgi:heme oxygenase (mycobilin-producing)